MFEQTPAFDALFVEVTGAALTDASVTAIEVTTRFTDFASFGARSPSMPDQCLAAALNLGGPARLELKQKLVAELGASEPVELPAHTRATTR